MLCDNGQDKRAQAFLDRFNAKTFQQRVPLTGFIELTSRCNLNCVHCYVSGEKRKNKNDAELSTDWWMSLIDAFARTGCLYLLFTGGETLLRPDFPEIYSQACRKGIRVTVFTNGTLVTERIMETFHALPPQCVEITLYGATAATYENITGVPGAFEKCMAGIHRLKKAGIHLKLKTMLLTVNRHELEKMQAFADELHVPFRYDATVFPRLDGDRAPLRYRVTAEDAIQKEAGDRKRVKQWHDLHQRLGHLTPSGKLYECGAGMTLFHVDSSGMLRPCFMVSGTDFDLNHKTFHDIWNAKDFLDFNRPGEMPESCKGCNHKVLCGYCPGFFKLENGDARIPSAFLCEIGARRGNMISNYIAEENSNADHR